MSPIAIIPAAGSGSRMKLDQPKQYHLLAGRPILIHTIKAFFDTPCIKRVVVVVPSDYQKSTESIINEYLPNANKPISVISGGARRQDSVLAGLKTIDEPEEIVLIHDGARPLIKPELISSCYEQIKDHGAAIMAVPAKDTLKQAFSDNFVSHTIDREMVYQAQTPQGAVYSLLMKCYASLGDNNITDESSLFELNKIPVKIVEGSETNIKITRPDDLIIAESIMNKQQGTTLRVGHGFDAHRFALDRKLVLGGVTIPYHLGLAGHSDADVLTHALCDAILGAIGAGDIGKHFPDSSDDFKDIYSINLLKHSISICQEYGYYLINADITVTCQEPKLAPFIEDMKQTIAKACIVSPEQINIKATTTEKMGFTGRKEGISCHAVVMVESS